MSTVESSTGEKRPLFRWAVAGTAALFLMTSAYQAAWGQGFCDPFYEDCDRGGDDDDGLSGGEIAAIVIGGLAAGYGIWMLAGKDDDDDDEEEQQSVMAPSLKSGATASELRLVAPKSALGAGERAVFDLQARSAVDGKWYSVTRSEAASIEVKDSQLVRQDGAKNSFSLPITAQGEKQAVVTGRLNRPGASPLVAQTVVQLGG